MDNGTIKPTAWKRRNEVEILELPSGQQVKIKKLGLLDLFLSGYLPVGLLQKTLKAFESISTTANIKAGVENIDISSLSDSDIQSFLSVVDKCVLKMVVEPKIAEGEPENEEQIKISDIPIDDKIFIFNQCTKSSLNTEQNFFRRPAPDNAPAQPGNGISHETEPIIVYTQSGSGAGI